MSRDQHCDDQHRPAAASLLHPRGALQVLFHFLLLIIQSLTNPVCVSDHCLTLLLCTLSETHTFSSPLIAFSLLLSPGQALTFPTCRLAGTSTQGYVPLLVSVTSQRSRVRQGEELLPCPSHSVFPAVSLSVVLFMLKVSLFVSVSGSVWSSYRKSCVDTVMKWLVPESSSRYINRMTNEALHKGSLYVHIHIQVCISVKITHTHPTAQDIISHL